MNIRTLKKLLDMIDVEEYGDEPVSFISANCSETHAGIASDMVNVAEYGEFAEKFRDAVGPEDFVFVIPKQQITEL